MGYTTDFLGRFKLNKELTDDLFNYLQIFNEMRHNKRNLTNIVNKPEKFGLDGEFFVLSINMDILTPTGIDKDVKFIGEYAGLNRRELSDKLYRNDLKKDYNTVARNCPSFFCQWAPANKLEIEWDGSEKFYCYDKWLQYIIDNFLKPYDYELNGKVLYRGESIEDIGYLYCYKNKVIKRSLDFKNNDLDFNADDIDYCNRHFKDKLI